MRPIVRVAIAPAGMSSTNNFADVASWPASSHAAAGQAAYHWEVQNV
jgi:hypothetical protein